jgi:hypothetical protein
MSRRVQKPFTVIRTSDRRSVLKSLFLREAVFSRAITPTEVKAGLLPKRAA